MDVKYYKWNNEFGDQSAVFRLIDGALQLKDGDQWLEADMFLVTDNHLTEIQE